MELVSFFSKIKMELLIFLMRPFLTLLPEKKLVLGTNIMKHGIANLVKYLLAMRNAGQILMEFG